MSHKNMLWNWISMPKKKKPNQMLLFLIETSYNITSHIANIYSIYKCVLCFNFFFIVDGFVMVCSKCTLKCFFCSLHRCQWTGIHIQFINRFTHPKKQKQSKTELIILLNFIITNQCVLDRIGVVCLIQLFVLYIIRFIRIGYIQIKSLQHIHPHMHKASTKKKIKQKFI